MELKYMMEKLQSPQTHIGLKQMIKEVDEDHDDKVSFREVFGLWGDVGMIGEYDTEQGQTNLISCFTNIEGQKLKIGG